MDDDSSSVRSIVKSFEALKAFAKFSAILPEEPEETSDAGVYNAIFRSLRENLLRDLE
jgi:hypothetical protein